jgi:hypothetical protein
VCVRVCVCLVHITVVTARHSAVHTLDRGGEGG